MDFFFWKYHVIYLCFFFVCTRAFNSILNLQVLLSAFDSDASLDVLDHPVLNLIYYMVFLAYYTWFSSATLLHCIHNFFLLHFTAGWDFTLSSSALHSAEVASQENISAISSNSLTAMFLCSSVFIHGSKLVILELSKAEKSQKNKNGYILVWLMIAAILFTCRKGRH